MHEALITLRLRRSFQPTAAPTGSRLARRASDTDANEERRHGAAERASPRRAAPPSRARTAGRVGRLGAAGPSGGERSRGAGTRRGRGPRAGRRGAGSTSRRGGAGRCGAARPWAERCPGPPPAPLPARLGRCLPPAARGREAADGAAAPPWAQLRAGRRFAPPGSGGERAERSAAREAGGAARGGWGEERGAGGAAIRRRVPRTAPTPRCAPRRTAGRGAVCRAARLRSPSRPACRAPLLRSPFPDALLFP